MNQRSLPDSVIKCLLKDVKEKTETWRETTFFFLITSVRCEND